MNITAFTDFLNEVDQFFKNDCILTEEKLYEMARVQEKNSGLPQMIFVSTRDYGTGNHWARIKVSNVLGTFSKDDNFVVTISAHPKVASGTPKYKQSQLNNIFDWVILNQVPLLKYWNNKYDSDVDFYNELKRI